MKARAKKNSLWRSLKKAWSHLVFLILPLIIPLAGYAQQDGQHIPTYGRWSVNAAFGNHTAGFPFQNLFTAFNPAISAPGVEFRLSKNLKHTFSIGSQNTLVLNEVTGNSFLGGISLNYTYTHNLGLYAGLELNLGGLAQFYPRQTYVYSEDFEKYEPEKAMPELASYSGFGITFGYDFAPKFKSRYAVFLRNKFLVQSPYFNADLFPILPYNIPELGVKIKFNTIFNNK